MDYDDQYVDKQKEKIESLLLEFEIHRNEVKKMIEELEDIRSKIDILIPTSMDKRYVRFFEEKVKSMTSFFNSLLEMRKEIAKSVKDEIEVRRRLTKEDDKLLDVEEILDVRSFAKKVKEFENETIDLRKERKKKFETTKKSLDKMDIDIPGITSDVEGAK